MSDSFTHSRIHASARIFLLIDNVRARPIKWPRNARKRVNACVEVAVPFPEGRGVKIMTGQTGDRRRAVEFSPARNSIWGSIPKGAVKLQEAAMATRGRKPVPSAIKLIQGNPGRRPINKKEPKPKPKVPSPPSALKGEALREWKRITKVLGPMWMLSDLDRAVLAAYCTAYARWKAATDGIAAAAKSTGHGGLLTETRNGNLIQNPLVGIQRRAAEDMVKHGAEFGLTPSARSRLKIENPNRKPNEFDEF